MYAMVSSANSCRVEKEELEDTIGVIKRMTDNTIVKRKRTRGS